MTREISSLLLRFTLLLVSHTFNVFAHGDVCYVPQFGDVTVVQYPLYISTFIEAKTILNINGGIQITIDQAPTFVILNTFGITTTTASLISRLVYKSIKRAFY